MIPHQPHNPLAETPEQYLVRAVSWLTDVTSRIILPAIDRMEQRQVKTMATLDDVLADVTAETSQIDSISTLFDGLKQQLADALAGAKLPADTQAKVDAIFSAAEANKQKIADAIAANSPPAPGDSGQSA